MPAGPAPMITISRCCTTRSPVCAFFGRFFERDHIHAARLQRRRHGRQKAFAGARRAGNRIERHALLFNDFGNQLVDGDRANALRLVAASHVNPRDRAVFERHIDGNRSTVTRALAAECAAHALRRRSRAEHQCARQKQACDLFQHVAVPPCDKHLLFLQIIITKPRHIVK